MGITNFEDEIIEGFKVEGMMKRVWASQLRMLEKVDKVCRQRGIEYFVHFGTLLGAVRHKGFIPWDDDVDIAMTRENFNKFQKVFKNVMPKNFRLNYITTKESHNQPFASITNREYPGDSDELTKEYFDCPYVLGMDVYPIDFLPRDKSLEDLQINLYNIAYCLGRDEQQYIESGEINELADALQNFSKIPIDKTKPIAPQAWKIADKIASLFHDAESDEMALMSDMVVARRSKRFNKEWVKKTVDMDFENIRVKAPAGYEEVLKVLYGDNYMEPMIFESHEYPFYRVQEEWLKSNQ